VYVCVYVCMCVCVYVHVCMCVCVYKRSPSPYAPVRVRTRFPRQAQRTIAFSHKKTNNLLYGKAYLSEAKLVLRAQQLHQCVLPSEPLPFRSQLFAAVPYNTPH
jgi:hypothetical protein